MKLKCWFLQISSNLITHIKSLHWLTVKVRSTCEKACLCYHCHSYTVPSYIADMLQKMPSHSLNTRSSPYTMPLFIRPAPSKVTHGDREFYFVSSSVWICIPNDVRCAKLLSSCRSRRTCRTCFVLFTITEFSH